MSYFPEYFLRMASSYVNENAPQCKNCRCGEGDTNIWTTKTPENLEKQVNKCPNCQVMDFLLVFLCS